MDPYQMVQLLGPWSEQKGPLYERLAHAFEQVIRTGELPAQTRLPAERWLAQCLGVSRSTIVAAYALLQERGWVTSRRGSGTQVCTFSPQRSLRLRRQQLNPLARGPVMDSYLSDHLEAIDLSAGAPAWPTGFALEECALLPHQIAASLEQYGYVPRGLPELRQAIAEYYTRSGLRTRPEQILVTTGAQQAIGLLATLLLQRGDTVILENPTFFGAIDTFRAAGARLAGVPNDASGLDLQRVSELLSARVAQCLYLIPTFHNPTANTLSELQRRELVTMAQQVNMPIIEDLTMANNVLEGQPPPPLATYAQDGGVITIGSLSKLFWAGLRVGWIRGSVPLIERLTRLKALTDLGSSMISQLIAMRLMASVEHVKQLRRQELTPRRDLLLEVLEQRVPSWSWRRPKGGLFVWVQLPEGDARDLAQKALHRGVIVTPGITLSVDGSHTGWLRIPFL
ncbi:MAG: PLP-dependent aminotransferase family protein, partial [Chloroflexota bacterium]